jgi:hypothetical protein
MPDKSKEGTRREGLPNPGALHRGRQHREPPVLESVYVLGFLIRRETETGVR